MDNLGRARPPPDCALNRCTILSPVERQIFGVGADEADGVDAAGQQIGTVVFQRAKLRRTDAQRLRHVVERTGRTGPAHGAALRRR